ncbi:hypothetical protein GW17_00003214 [Ensete ventricosum]|nr:hypothetical protein GW17_00003214 [Ensete ventricosum]
MHLQTIKIPCGGWRRPFSFHFGAIPEHQNCFAYLKVSYLVGCCNCRYSPIEMGGWSKSILLGEHVGGSAVRFDVALLVPTKSPILSLQHIVVTGLIVGAWTDGTWAFSTGLDQRIRCWKIDDSCRLSEHASVIISVPEPEALDAIVCDRLNPKPLKGTGIRLQLLEGACKWSSSSHLLLQIQATCNFDLALNGRVPGGRKKKERK